MAHQKQPDRWKSTLLAATLAVAGAQFLFDRLEALVRTSVLSFSAALHSAPMLLVVAGAILLLADQSTRTPVSGNPGREEGKHEL